MQARIFHATDHDMDFHQIDKDALYVINRLKDAGFVAYLVGGGVRDLLIKKKPKDFDISTSAKPEQIKQILDAIASSSAGVFVWPMCVLAIKF